MLISQTMLTVCWRSHKRHETTAWSSRQWLRRSRFTLWKADISCRSCVWTCLCLMTLTPAPTTGSCTSCLGPTLAARASTSSRYSVLINKHQLWIIYGTSQYTSTVVWMIIDAQLHACFSCFHHFNVVWCSRITCSNNSLRIVKL